MNVNSLGVGNIVVRASTFYLCDFDSCNKVVMKLITKGFFHSSQKPTRKLAARTFVQSQYLKALVVSLGVGFCDE